VPDGMGVFFVAVSQAPQRLMLVIAKATMANASTAMSISTLAWPQPIMTAIPSTLAQPRQGNARMLLWVRMCSV
jgi:hypothetical protein